MGALKSSIQCWDTVREILQVDTWYKYLHLNRSRKCCLQTTSMKATWFFFFFQSGPRVQSEASGTFRKKVFLLYFQQGCTVQSHSHFQSPRLNPLTGEGVCLRIALTAGARLSVLAMPSKGVLADLHSGFLFKKKPFLPSLTLPLTPSSNLFLLNTWNTVLFCWQSACGIPWNTPLNVEFTQNSTEVTKA